MSIEQAAIKRATLAAHQAVEKLDAAAIEELMQLYRQAAEDIARQIAGYAGQDGNVMLWQLQELLAQVRARLDVLARARDVLMEESLQTAAQLGVLPMTGEGILSIGVAQQIKTETLQLVRTFIAADGLQLSDRIWRLDRHARDVVVNAIEQAIIQGQGAVQAARELLMRGVGVSAEIADKMSAANAEVMGKTVAEVMTGNGSPMDNALRLMRTEINRAHGEAYIKSALSLPTVAGVKFILSPAHPKPDICDLFSRQNLYGLGAGVYPSRETCPWPAHPNTLSFLSTVFADKVTEADRAGKETSLAALARLTPEQRKGALGVGKAEVFEQGKLRKGMIRSRLSAVRKRIGNANAGS